MLTPPNKPEYIYKYCSASRAAQILTDRAFYFTPASQLNDLYEFRAKSLLTVDAKSRIRVFAKRLMAEGLFDNFDEALEIANDLETEDVNDTWNDVLPQIHAALQSALQHSGVTCFTSSRNDQRMWGTYGDNHQGAVLEFSADPSHSRYAKHLMPVLYIDSKPPICPSELLTHTMSIDQWFLGVMFCMKHYHWRDEREWRLLLLADTPQPSQDRLIPFEREALTRVFLGPRIDSKSEQEIRDAASTGKRPIPVFKRNVSAEDAAEENVGFEEINSFEQLKYWANRCRGDLSQETPNN